MELILHHKKLQGQIQDAKDDKNVKSKFTAGCSEAKDVSYDTMYFLHLDVLSLYPEFLCKNAPRWPCQQLTLASFPWFLPFLHRAHIWDVVDVWAQRNPFLLDAQNCFLKDATSKMRAWKWLTVFPKVQTLRLKHHVDRFKTGYEQHRSVYCRWQTT